MSSVEGRALAEPVQLQIRTQHNFVRPIANYFQRTSHAFSANQPRAPGLINLSADLTGDHRRRRNVAFWRTSRGVGGSSPRQSRGIVSVRYGRPKIWGGEFPAREPGAAERLRGGSLDDALAAVAWGDR